MLEIIHIIQEMPNRLIEVEGRKNVGKASLFVEKRK
jgi:hypothetical protein